MTKANLVVNIVVVSVVAREPLQRVERQGVSAVIVDSLEGGNYEQKRSLANRHASQPLRDDSTARIKNEALDGVVIQCAVRVRYIQPVVPGVEGLEQERVYVHGAVQEVLPGVDQKAVESVGES